MVVNVPSPAQATENLHEISADFWHETRIELRKRFGKELFILAQCAPAGDQSPHVLIGKRAEERMWRLKGRDMEQNPPREEIAKKIADAVEDILPYAEKEIDRKPVLIHRMELIDLPLRKLSEEDVEGAAKEAAKHRAEYERLLGDIEKNPAARKEKRWYTDVTREFGMLSWYEGVAKWFKLQQDYSAIPFETHVVILGDMAFATNSFELYLDYGIQIRERSPAAQTFLVQLAGPGNYLPTRRSIAGGGYGSVAAGTGIGPEGGEKLVNWTVETINRMWREAAG
jgi:hypothetical protein